jgi:hypothetical protein
MLLVGVFGFSGPLAVRVVARRQRQKRVIAAARAQAEQEQKDMIFEAIAGSHRLAAPAGALKKGLLVVRHWKVVRERP